MNPFVTKLCLFGASPGTGNQGVNALCWSVLKGLADRGCNDVDVFNYGQGTRISYFVGDESKITFRLHGITIGKQFWQANHLWRINLAATIGLRHDPTIKIVCASDAVLDASGGDSFTDLYGEARFQSIIAPKHLALSLGRPLILLPQTYGPFSSKRIERIARDLVASARLVYARDPHSYYRLKVLLGGDFDPERHREGVDLAFGLPPRKPDNLELQVIKKLYFRCHKQPLIGINVSGLIANCSAEATARFGLNCDYRELMRLLLEKLLLETDAHILLIPHVHAPAGHFEADLDASMSLFRGLLGQFDRDVVERVCVVTRKYDACELKWLIGQTDWFCGARMHSNIAALSSCVPCAAIAYSSKSIGIFNSCGVSHAVVDLRTSTVDEALERLVCLWEQRDIDSFRLKNNLPAVFDRASGQLDSIVSCAQSEHERNLLATGS